MVYQQGFFQIVNQGGSTFLRLFPSREGGSNPDPREIAAYLDSENIHGYDINIIDQKLKTLGDTPELVRVSLEPTLPADERMQVDVSRDHMRAVARFYPPSAGGDFLTLASVKRLLESRNICSGIDELSIRRFLHHREYCRDYVVASGTPARQGKDAWVEYHFDLDKKPRPTLLPDGSVDFHHLDGINHVTEGEKLATLHPADPGDEGKDIFGSNIKPHKTRNGFLKHGRNITVSEDGMEMYSDIDGHVRLEGDQVFVSDTYEVLGDVDASTGDIDYDGNVDVKGNVRTGFVITATGDINVKGVVEGAVLRAGGKVVIQRGIQGMNKGEVRCRGSLYAKFIENASVKADGSVITEAIMHSDVFSGGDIIADGKKGLINGGRCCSRSKIELKTGGSDMGTVTKLEVGADPELVEAYHKLTKRVPEIQTEIDNNQKVVDMYSKRLARKDRLKKEQIESLKEAQESVQSLTKELAESNEKLEKYKAEIEANENGVVLVSSLLYPGVEVTIADVSMRVKHETKYCRLVRDGADIRVQAY